MGRPKDQVNIKCKGRPLSRTKGVPYPVRTQRIELRHSGFEQAQSAVEKGVNRLTVGVIIAASIIAGAMILNSKQRLLAVTFTFLGLKAVPLTALLGLAGYAVATLLGIWLIVSILKSGRL